MSNNLDISSLTSELFVRGVEDSDIPFRVQWFNNPQINRTLNFALPVTQVATRQWLARASQSDNRKDFTLCLSESGSPVGYGGLLGINWKDGKAEIYGGIGEVDCWGKGYGFSLWLLILEFAFCELGLNKIYSTVWTQNYGMQRIHEKAGFVLEGTLREDIRSHGELRDRHYYGILRSEFFERFGS